MPKIKWLGFSKKLSSIGNYPNSDFKDALILMVNYVIKEKNNVSQKEITIKLFQMI
jgi:hypothetical protein